MKILFITKKWVIDPLGIAYLSSYLKQQGHEVKLVRPEDGVWEMIWSFKPDILAYSVTTGLHKFYLDLNSEIKKRYKAISVFGGAHPTYFPEMKIDKDVDFIVRGEGEVIFARLLERIGEGWWSEEKEFYSLFLVKNLDELPFPDRELIYQFPENHKNRIKNVMTSRGCPFKCNYCYNSLYQKLYGKDFTIRYRSVDNVIKECLELKKYPLEVIFFADDEFVANKQRFLEFALRYKEEVNVPYHCQIRIELLDEDRIKWLKDSGCISLTFAIESGNEKMRKEVLGRNISNKRILDGCILLQKYNIKYRTENMIGLPFESFEEAWETLEFNIKCKPTIAWASIFQPYPKTGLGEYCIEQGLFDGNVDSIKSTFFEDTPLNVHKDYRKKIVNLQRLFGVVCSYPQLKGIARQLVEWEPNKLYSWIYSNWKKYCYDNKLYA